jgi:uncharacterized protein (DUF433 family)
VNRPVFYVDSRETEPSPNQVSRLDHITVGPLICLGLPVVRRLRGPVEMLHDGPASEVSFDKILGDYLDPERDDTGADQLIKRQLRRWTVRH